MCSSDGGRRFLRGGPALRADAHGGIIFQVTTRAESRSSPRKRRQSSAASPAGEPVIAARVRTNVAARIRACAPVGEGLVERRNVRGDTRAGRAVTAGRAGLTGRGSRLTLVWLVASVADQPGGAAIGPDTRVPRRGCIVGHTLTTRVLLIAVRLARVLPEDAPALGGAATLGALIHRERSANGDASMAAKQAARPLDTCRQARLAHAERSARLRLLTRVAITGG
jgi:hypothetical protein